MSADLLAEFGSSGHSTKPESSSASAWEQPSLEDEADGWGDFQSPDPGVDDFQQLKDLSLSYPKDEGADEWRRLGACENRPVESAIKAPPQENPLNILCESALKSQPRGAAFDLLGEPSLSSPEELSGPTFADGRDAPSDMSPPGVEVLFDATDQIYDDFGDFETVPPEVPPLAPSSPQTRTQVVDLLGVSPLASPYLERPKSPSSKERNPFADLSAATKPQQSARKAAKEASTPVTAWPSFTSPKPAAFQDSPALPAPPSDEWADFPDDEDSPSATEQWKSSVPKRTAMPLTLPPRASRPPATSSPSTARPTNVPPPSILLTLFPPLLTSFNPANASSLVAHLSTARTLARILAGRRQRWKRDASLAQSTKIGPASSGRSSGMKLAGLDRAESAREEREAAEVLRAWRTSVGRLRAAVGTARHHSASSEPWRYHVPALASPAPQTRLATASQGGISAPQACALCGLRRNERVLGVDDDDTSTSPADEGDGAARTQVRDSFGEWWAEHWGHVECRDFWTTHEGTLRGR